MNRFTTIPNEATLDYLIDRVPPAAAHYDQYLFGFMRKYAPKSYDGGLWEIREYPNGAFAYVFPDSTIVPEVQAPTQVRVSCSLEALSLVANTFILNGMIELAQEHGDDEMAERFHAYHEALMDAVCGRLNSVVDNKIARKPSPAELAEPRQKHPECDAILTLID